MLKKCPKNVEFLSPHPLGLGVVCLFAHSLAHPDSPFSLGLMIGDDRRKVGRC